MMNLPNSKKPEPIADPISLRLFNHDSPRMTSRQDSNRRIDAAETHFTPPHLQVESPSLEAYRHSSEPAYEVKFLVSETVAQAVENRIPNFMELDQYCQKPGCGASPGGYATTTLYLDTPNLDVLRRNVGFRKRKYRLRSYENCDAVFLEQKSKRGDRVRKRRSQISGEFLLTGALKMATPAVCGAIDSEPEQLCHESDWFRHAIVRRSLRPVLAVRYERSAWVGQSEQGSIRATLDRAIRSELRSAWDLSHFCGGSKILEQSVILELKFRGAMPIAFKQLVAEYQLATGKASKYRLGMLAAGILLPHESTPLNNAE